MGHAQTFLSCLGTSQANANGGHAQERGQVAGDMFVVHNKVGHRGCKVLHDALLLVWLQQNWLHATRRGYPCSE